MENKRDNTLTRRQFISKSAKVSAGAFLSAKSIRNVLDKKDGIKNTRSYNPDMEYRRLGKTDLWVSAVCLGGHWKRIEKVIKSGNSVGNCEKIAKLSRADMEAFHKNRYDVVSRCMEVGINLIDFAGAAEPPVYIKALKGRRDKMYLAWSMGAQEMRHPEHRTAKKQLEILDKGLKDTGIDYVDIWRIMAFERGSKHTEKEVEEMLKALETAKRQGKCRFTGFSTHDRKWAKMLIENYPDLMQVLVTPYTAKSKVLPKDSLFDAVKKYDVGVLGIKPFASNSLFKGDGSPDSTYAEEDARRARMAVRYILTNPAMTAPIPGLISIRQVDNMVKAVKERREFDQAENIEFNQITDEMWANLTEDYQWLKEWEYV
jgi:aryl-alcohol dehydrogenase-like predicted oxidoreductase